MANGGMLSGFAGYEVIMQWVVYAGWFLLFLVIALGMVAMVLVFIVNAKKKKIVELNMVTNQLKEFSATEKKNKSKIKQTFINKLKRFLPRIQQRDHFLKNKKEHIFLLKDNNGLHHTLRIPTQEELTKWYSSQGIKLEDEIKKVEKQKDPVEKLKLLDQVKSKLKGIEHKGALNVVGSVYLLPNPQEDLEWLAEEHTQAGKSFGTGLLKHPLMAWVATLSVCAFTFIITIIMAQKL